MKITFRETPKERGVRLHQWHRVFAWLPKKTGDHEGRWMEYIERRAKNPYCEDFSWSLSRWGEWEYRSMKDAFKAKCGDG